MIALTIHQPWAWAVVEGHKALENRSWSTGYRGLLAIHASRTWDVAGAEAVPTLLPPGVLTPGMWRQTLPAGAVVGVAELVDVCPGGPVSGSPLRACRCTDRWAMPGQRHWLLRDVRRLPVPVPVRGRQQLWHLPSHIAAAVAAQLRPVESEAS